MDIKGLVCSILEYKKNKDTSQLQLIEIYKKQIKHDLIAAFEMSRDIVRENETLFLSSPSFLTFLLKLIDSDSSLSFVLPSGPFRNRSETILTQPHETSNEKVLELQKKRNELEKEFETSNEKGLELQKKLNELEEKCRTSNEKALELQKKLKECEALRTNNAKVLQDLEEKFAFEKNKMVEEHTLKIKALNEKVEHLESKNVPFEEQKTPQASSQNEKAQFGELEDSLKVEKSKTIELQSQLTTQSSYVQKAGTFLDYLYKFLLLFNGDTYENNPNVLTYLEEKLKDSLERFKTDYQMLQDWAFLKFNLPKENFNVPNLVSSYGPQIASIEDVCLKPATPLTTDLDVIVQEHTFMNTILKEHFGEDIFTDITTYTNKIKQIALESNTYKMIKENLKQIFEEDTIISEESVLEKLLKVIDFVYKILNYRVAEKSNFLPEHINSLKNDLLASPMIMLSRNEYSVDTRESELHSKLDDCERELEAFKSSTNILKNKLHECEQDVDAWKTKCDLQNREFHLEKQNLSLKNQSDSLELQNCSEKNTQLNERMTQIHLQLNTCLADKKQIYDQLEMLQQSVREREEMLILKTNNIEKLKEDMQLLATKKQELEKEILDLKAKQSSDDYTSMQENFERELKKCLENEKICTTEKESLQKHMTLLTEENENLKQNIENDRKKIEHLNQEIQTLQETTKGEFIDEFENEEEFDLRKITPPFPSRKRKQKYQDIGSDEYSEHSKDFELPMESEALALSRCIQEKDKRTIELAQCHDKLQRYENTFEDANYIATYNQKGTALTMENLKSLFVAFYNFHFQKRAVKVAMKEEDIHLLSTLKELLDSLEKSDPGEHNSILYWYIQKQISSLTETEWPAAHLDKVDTIDMLLQSAMNETKRHIKIFPNYSGTRSALIKVFHPFNFSNESVASALKNILECLKNICNTNIVTDMEDFLRQLDTVSSQKYDEFTGKDKISKHKFIIKIIKVFSLEFPHH